MPGATHRGEFSKPSHKISPVQILLPTNPAQRVVDPPCAVASLVRDPVTILLKLYLPSAGATATRERTQSFSPDSWSGKLCVKEEPRVQEKLRKQAPGTLNL